MPQGSIRDCSLSNQPPCCTSLKIKKKKIIMEWRCRNWPEEHYAIVALNFVPTLGQTELQLEL